MRKYPFLVLIAALAMAMACSSRQAETTVTSDAAPADSIENNDSAVYGLACDGTTDTILVVLTDISADPDTFDILEASRQHRVFGRPMIGDRVAVVLQSDSSNAALAVVDMDQLKGTWCYMVTPTLRRRADVSKKMEKEFLERVPDTLLQRLLKPREYGFELLNDGMARPIGIVRHGNTTDDQSPVEFPPVKRYRDWHLTNGRLVLNESRMDSLGNRETVSSDTAEFVLLRRDSLVLRFADGEQSYYRKAETEE